jgi:hypothetical protein
MHTPSRSAGPGVRKDRPSGRVSPAIITPAGPECEPSGNLSGKWKSEEGVLSRGPTARAQRYLSRKVSRKMRRELRPRVRGRGDVHPRRVRA